jgi:hypothetical protein
MAFVAVESVTRRALPWARLLRLRMSFNGPAPRRWMVARDLWSLSNDGTLELGRVRIGGALVAAQALFAATFGPRSARAVRLVAAGAVAVACTLALVALQSVIRPPGPLHRSAMGHQGVPPGVEPSRSALAPGGSSGTLAAASGTLPTAANALSNRAPGPSAAPSSSPLLVAGGASSWASPSEQTSPPSGGGVPAKAPIGKQSPSASPPAETAPSPGMLGTPVSVKVGAGRGGVAVGVTSSLTTTVAKIGSASPPIHLVLPPKPTQPVVLQASVPPLPVDLIQPSVPVRASVSAQISPPSVSLNVNEPSLAATNAPSPPQVPSSDQLALGAGADASIAVANVAASTDTVSTVDGSTVTVSTVAGVTTTPPVDSSSPVPAPVVPVAESVAESATDPLRATSVAGATSTSGAASTLASPALGGL